MDKQENMQIKADEIVSYYSIKTYVDGGWKYRLYISIERPAITVESLYDMDTQEDADIEIERLERENDKS